LYPNPVSDLLFIEIDRVIESVRLYDILGQVISVDLNGNAIDVSQLQNGPYILEINTDGQVFSKKVMVQK